MPDVLSLWLLSHRYRILAGGLAFTGVAAAVALGPAPGAAALAGACLAHFSATALAVAILRSAPLPAAPAPTPDSGPMPGAGVLRFLAAAVPPLLALQVILGSAYRHKLLGLLPHAAGAATAGMAALALAVFSLIAMPGRPAVRFPARCTAGLVCLQVLLGIAALLVRISSVDVAPWLAAAPSLHVVTGSFTLAAGVILSIQVLRSVPVPAGSDLSPSGATVAP